MSQEYVGMRPANPKPPTRTWTAVIGDDITRHSSMMLTQLLLSAAPKEPSFPAAYIAHLQTSFLNNSIETTSPLSSSVNPSQ
ncbi:uncharacterized protein N7459_008315 [Penicillium hispanicum]|uniref:uncharacterized protein n=1 Tax=Penicillium hispanicum TaxID=1080232 RepID=UPI002541AFB1|nr:uncharacterized protein N7459_008315 [Penicillium hispanicum]KAJ5573888.1 hypothetical protein N7459_008315 [Penicillium hispanicum]